MSDSNHQALTEQSNTPLELQKFEQLNLKEIGLNTEDFNEVVNAHKDLHLLLNMVKILRPKHPHIQMNYSTWSKIKT